MPTSLEIDTLIARLEKLERQNQRWRRGTAAILLAAGSLFLMAQAKAGSSPKVVQAVASELVDKTGKVIATLDGRDAPSRVKLNVSDGAGNDRFHLIVSGDGGLMRLAGPTDRTASLVVGSNGPALLLEEPGRKAQVTLAIGQKGAVLSLTDQDQLGAAMVAGPQGRAVAIYDANGKPVWSAPAQ
jgi:hypothetical protein